MAPRVGNDFLLYVQTGTDATTGAPIFTEVGGQRGLSTETSREMIDASTKNSDHSSSLYGRQDTTASLEGIMMEGDAGYDALENAINTKKTIVAEMRDRGVAYRRATVLISSLSREFADNDVVSASMEMQLNSPWAAPGGAAAAAAAGGDTATPQVEPSGEANREELLRQLSELEGKVAQLTAQEATNAEEANAQQMATA